ncbi:hypothetical protein KM043_006707 [Ampulex compressa]|nr:hypothetical protein KM043_006707 [Ampulex compressa]
MQKFDNTIQCSDSWFDVSAKGLAEYWQCKGDSVLNWKDKGYKTFFDILSRKIPDSKNNLPIMEKIEFNTAVSTIDYSSKNGIVVKTKGGSTYVASHVIFTPSLGVLKHDHTKMFIPPLPELKQRAIAGSNIGTVNKIFLEFKHRWWNEDLGTFHLLWSKEVMVEFLKTHGEGYRWLCDICSIFTVDYQPRVLCVWIIGKGARYTELLSESDIFDGITLMLEMFLGKAYNVIKPDRILRSKWYTDECFRGCYSFRSMTTEEMNVRATDLSDPITTDNNKPILLFAGEATHEHYYSTVHGAVETGFREADRLIDYYRRLKSHL